MSPGTFDFTGWTADSIGASTEKILPTLVNPAPSITTRSLSKGFILTSAGTISGQSLEAAGTKVQITLSDGKDVASTKSYASVVGGSTSTLAEEVLPPPGYALGQNYPSSFNPTPEIRFGIPTDTHVQISL